MLYDYLSIITCSRANRPTQEPKWCITPTGRFLAAYRGADGIKTGYTRAAGFNLVSSAKRGDERIIATVFGGQSTAARNAKVAELLDLGFRRAPAYGQNCKNPRCHLMWATAAYAWQRMTLMGLLEKTIRVRRVISETMRPRARPHTRSRSGLAGGRSRGCARKPPKKRCKSPRWTQTRFNPASTARFLRSPRFLKCRRFSPSHVLLNVKRMWREKKL